MFEKKEYIVSSSFGVCRVEKVTKLVVGREAQMEYYVLQSAKDAKKKSYIPVENPKTVLRYPMSEEEAQEAVERFVQAKVHWSGDKRITFAQAKAMLDGGQAEEWAEGCACYFLQGDKVDLELKEVLEKIAEQFMGELVFVWKKSMEEVRRLLEVKLL